MIFAVFELLFWVALAAVPGWFFGGALGASLATLVPLLTYALLQVWKLERLERWLAAPDLRLDPPWKGTWLDVAMRVQRLVKQLENKAQAHEKKLNYFLQAIQASPNGVILLDDQARIDWCNDTAAAHLGLDPQRDRMQHIVHLVRDPVFAKYFAQHHHPCEVLIDGRSVSLSQARKLSVQLHTYGDGRLLLLTRDITELAKADAMRRDFVANVSHEIRTPLTVLGGFVETMQSIPLRTEEIQHYLQLMSVQSDRMQSLVADLLTLSQLEGSQPPGVHEKVSLPDLVRQVMSDAQALSVLLASQNQGTKHALVFDRVPQVDWLGSRSELMSAVSNLVSNAVRYTPLGGLVHVTFNQTPEGMTLAVKDTGPGIAPEHLPRLSERFYRVDRSRSRETGGTGLGLAITKHVMQRHGGELRIESELGKGSTFMLLMPLSRVSSQAD
jgi:two-component system phosphate regulon sensor histidine kinase PhoR